MRLRVFPTVQAPSQARQEVASLTSLIDDDSLADVKAVTSELVSICVAHGASRPIEVDLELDDDRLDGVVSDDGSGVRAIVRARSHADDSLVLRIVEGLVEEWGTDAAETEIWFHMGVQPVAGRAGASRN